MYLLYKIVCTVNNKVYIGITKDLDSRIRGHRTQATTGETPLYQDMRAYGQEKFTYHLLERFSKKVDALLAEKLRITHHRETAYNVASGGSTNTTWWQDKSDKALLDIRNKMKKARKGRTPALGMRHTEETIAVCKEAARKHYLATSQYLNMQEICSLPFREASKIYGISKTHYYRLRRRVRGNDSC